MHASDVFTNNISDSLTIMRHVLILQYFRLDTIGSAMFGSQSPFFQHPKIPDQPLAGPSQESVTAPGVDRDSPWQGVFTETPIERKPRSLESAFESAAASKTLTSQQVLMSKKRLRMEVTSTPISFNREPVRFSGISELSFEKQIDEGAKVPIVNNTDRRQEIRIKKTRRSSVNPTCLPVFKSYLKMIGKS